MAYLIGIPTMALLALLQSTILGYPLLLEGRPDLVLLAVIGWGLTGRTTETIVLAFIGGLFLDLFTAMPFGVNALAMVVVAFIVTLFEGRIWEANLLTPLAIALITSFVYFGIMVGVVFIMGRPIDLTTAVRRVILPSMFLNLVLVLPVTQAAAALARRLFAPEVKI